MQSIQTSATFSLSSVKPLDKVLQYRKYCVEATRKALTGKKTRRERSPIDGGVLEPWKTIEGLEYLRCPRTGSLFLAELPSPEAWKQLLMEVGQYHDSPKAFFSDLSESRLENVFEPKLHWIQNTIRLQEFARSKAIEVVVQPSPLTKLLKKADIFSEVVSVCETDFSTSDMTAKANAAILLESLDRALDPSSLLNKVSESLASKGLIFITALVSSGFDMTILGSKTVYLYPPDRMNCFSLKGLQQLIKKAGFSLLEVSTPGVLDLEIVKAHLHLDPSLPLSSFEREVLAADPEAQSAFQAFLQQSQFSSFARIVARKNA